MRVSLRRISVSVMHMDIVNAYGPGKRIWVGVFAYGSR